MTIEDIIEVIVAAVTICGVIGLFAVAIALVAIVLYCTWMVSGFICTSMRWDALDIHAQIITFIVMLAYMVKGSSIKSKE